MTTLRRRHAGNSVDRRKFEPINQSNGNDAINPSLGTVVADINAGCLSGATLTGPSNTFTGGQRIFVEGWASAPGTLFLDTSSDAGATWPNTDSEPITAGDHVRGIASTIGGANRYRLRFVCGTMSAASRVSFASQARA